MDYSPRFQVLTLRGTASRIAMKPGSLYDQIMNPKKGIDTFTPPPAQSFFPEVFLSQGMSTGQVCRKLGIARQTYYR
jgi:hypothetical protein